MSDYDFSYMDDESFNNITPSKVGSSARKGLYTPKKEDPGFLSNMANLAIGGGRGLIATERLSGDVISGDFDDNAAQIMADETARRQAQYMPPELAEVQGAFVDEAVTLKEAEGFGEHAGAIVDFAKEFGKQIFTNPKGVAYLTAEQIANMAPSMAGAYGGAKVGALATAPIPVPGARVAGAVIGSVVGAFGGGLSTEAGAAFLGRATEELSRRGLPTTEEGFATLLADQEWRDTEAHNATMKGVGTAATDAAFTALGGWVASGPRRMAIKEARVLMGVKATVKEIAGKADEIYKATSKVKKVASVAGGVAIDTLGEGGSEAAGQKIGYGEINSEEVALEMMGSIGSSFGETLTMAKQYAQNYRKDSQARSLLGLPPNATGPLPETAPEDLPVGSPDRPDASEIDLGPIGRHPSFEEQMERDRLEEEGVMTPEEKNRSLEQMQQEDELARDEAYRKEVAKSEDLTTGTQVSPQAQEAVVKQQELDRMEELGVLTPEEKESILARMQQEDETAAEEEYQRAIKEVEGDEPVAPGKTTVSAREAVEKQKKLDALEAEGILTAEEKQTILERMSQEDEEAREEAYQKDVKRAEEGVEQAKKRGQAEDPVAAAKRKGRAELSAEILKNAPATPENKALRDSMGLLLKEQLTVEEAVSGEEASETNKEEETTAAADSAETFAKSVADVQSEKGRVGLAERLARREEEGSDLVIPELDIIEGIENDLAEGSAPKRGVAINAEGEAANYTEGGYAEWFSDKGFTKKETLNVIGKYKRGDKLTEQQAGLVGDILALKRADLEEQSDYERQRREDDFMEGSEAIAARDEVMRVDALEPKTPPQTPVETPKSPKPAVEEVEAGFKDDLETKPIKKETTDGNRKTEEVTTKKSEEEAGKEGKEPWQITQDEWVDGHVKSSAMHEEHVRQAVKRGDKVPEEVLSEYPGPGVKGSGEKAQNSKAAQIASGDLVLTKGNKPFKTRKNAETAAKNRGLDKTHKPVEVVFKDGGAVEKTVLGKTEVPEKVETVEKTGSDTHKTFVKSLYDGKISIDEYKQQFTDLLKNKESIIAELSKMTKAQLLKMVGEMRSYHLKNEKKAVAVNATYNDMLDDFSLGRSLQWTMGAGNSDAARVSQVESTTQEQLDAFTVAVEKSRVDRAKQNEQFIESIKDPKTLEDFDNFLRAQGIKGAKNFKEAFANFTPEQRETYDKLKAGKSRGERADKRKTSVMNMGVTTGAEIVATKHTRDGHDLYVVKMADRVEKDVYREWNSAAKKMGGWYSRFRGNGAVPGFQFKDRESAEAFKSYISGGDTEAASAQVKVKRDAYADDRSQSAVERLTEMADRLDEKADEALNQDRKVNTSRRAGMAVSALLKAESEKAMVGTMRNIANGIKSGTVKFLDRVRQKVQVAELQSIVSNEHNRMLREKYPNYSDFEKHKGEVPTSEVADGLNYPAFTAYRSDIARIGRQLLDSKGTKLLGQKIMKVAEDVTNAYIKFAKENLHTVSTFARKDGSLAVFKTKADAEMSIATSGFKGKATVLPFKRGENIIIISSSEAQRQGIWEGDDDKRITLSRSIGDEIMSKAGKIDIAWQFSSVNDRIKRLEGMGLETGSELRAAVREFIELQTQPKELSEVKKLEMSMVGRVKDGLDFFPTPESTADEMVAAADIQEGQKVLEPSAGWGHIAERIRESGVDPDVVEMSSDRQKLLEAKGFNVVGRDFMDMEGEQYDKIIMNPPFSERRDAEHVKHAYTLLNPGGRIVAIMGEGVFFGKDKKAQEFRTWLEDVGGTEEKLEQGTFLDPSLPVNTAVNSRMVVIDKPDKGVALFTRTTNPNDTKPMRSMVVKKVEQVLRSLKLYNAPPVITVQSEADLPKHLIDYINKEEAQGQVPALFDPNTGNVYMISDNVRDSTEIRSNIMHEIFGHFGLRGLLGDNLDQVLDMVSENFDLTEIARIYKHDLNTTEGKRAAAEEKLAFMQQDASNRELGAAKRIYAKIRTLLRQLGFIQKMTDADIAQLLTDAHAFAKSGKRGETGIAAKLAPVFSKRQMEAFYSKLNEVVTGKFQGMKARSVENFLLKQGVKKAELEATGIKEWLSAMNPTAKVTKQEVAGFVKANSVELDEVVLGDALTGGGTTDADIISAMRFRYGTISVENDTVYVHEDEDVDDGDIGWDSMSRDEAVSNFLEGGAGTHFSTYTEPGAVAGSYREMFVTAPEEFKELISFELSAKGEREAERLAENDRAANEDANIEDYYDEVLNTNDADSKGWAKESIEKQSWEDGHSEYADIENPIVRIRFNETTGPNGERTMRVEEMQGPNPDNQEKMPGYLKDNIYNLGVKKVLAYAKANGFDGVSLVTKEVPSTVLVNADKATFIHFNDHYEPKQNHSELLIWDEDTNLIFSENFYDDTLNDDEQYARIKSLLGSDNADKLFEGTEEITDIEIKAETTTLSPGETQADRYSLEKQVNKIESVRLKDGAWDLQIYDKEGGLVPARSGEMGLTDEQLRAFVGKTLANNMIANKGKLIASNNRGEVYEYSGLDLRVGGEGLKTLYDVTLPKMFESYGKGKMVDNQMMLTDKTPASYPKFSMRMKPAGDKIAKEINKLDAVSLNYDGAQLNAKDDPAFHLFTVYEGPATGATFSVKTLDQATVKAKLDSKVGEFGGVMFSKAMTKEQEKRATSFGAARTKIDEAKEALTPAFNEFMYQVVDKNRPWQLVQRQLKNVTDKMNVFLKETARPKITADRILRAQEDLVVPLTLGIAKAKLEMSDVENYALALQAPAENKRLAQANSLSWLKTLAKMVNAEDRKYINATIKEISKDFEKSPSEFYKLLNMSLEDHKNEPGVAKLQAKWVEKWAGEEAHPAGLTINQSKEIIKQYKDNKDIEGLRLQLKAINDETTRILYEAGTIAKEGYNKRIDNEFYVPLQREGFEKQRPNPLKTRGGSSRAVVNIIANSVANLEYAISRAEKAKSAKALTELIKANPDPDFWTVEDVAKEPRFDDKGNIHYYPDPSKAADNQFAVMVDGKQKLLTFQKDDQASKQILKLLKNDDQEMGVVVKSLAAVNRYLSTVNTMLSPEFMLSNFPRDLQTALMNVPGTGVKSKGLVRTVPGAINAIWNVERGKKPSTDMERMYDRMKAAGGKIDWSDIHGTVKSRVNSLQRSIDEAKGKTPIRKQLKSFFDIVSSANTTVENGIRLSVFEAAIKQRYTDERAAQIASDITVDFTRKGAAGPTINAFYLFANASIQGNYRMLRAIGKSKTTQKMVGGIVMAGFSMGLVNAMQGGGDEDWWKDVSDHTRERNMVLMIPGIDTNIKIPMPYGYNLFYNMGTEMARMITEQGYKPAAGLSRLGGSLASTFNPMAAGSLLQTLSPTVFDPFVMVGENKSWHGGPLMPEKSSFIKGDQPDSSRHFRSARQGSVAVAQGLNALFDGSKARSGAIDISPETIDMMIDQVGGSMLKFATDIIGTPIKALSGQDIQIKEVPGLRRFLGSKSEYAESQRYFDTVNQIETYKRELKEYKGTPRYGETVKKYGRLRRFVKPLANVEKELRRLRKIRNSRRARGLDATGVEAAIKRKYENFNRFYARVMK